MYRNTNKVFIVSRVRTWNIVEDIIKRTNRGIKDVMEGKKLGLTQCNLKKQNFKMVAG